MVCALLVSLLSALDLNMCESQWKPAMLYQMDFLKRATSHERAWEVTLLAFKACRTLHTRLCQTPSVHFISKFLAFHPWPINNLIYYIIVI